MKQVESMHQRHSAWISWELDDPWTWITAALAIPAVLAVAGWIWAGLPGRWVIAAAAFAGAAGMHRNAEFLRRARIRPADASMYQGLAVALLVLGTLYLLISLMAL